MVAPHGPAPVATCRGPEEMHRSEFLLRLWEIARAEFAAREVGRASDGEHVGHDVVGTSHGGAMKISS